MNSKHNKGFTLIEVLVVVGIIIVLTLVVLYTLNPHGLISQGQDGNRVANIGTLDKAISLYYSDAISNPNNLYMGSSSIVYLSIPDPTATTTAGTNCAGIGISSTSTTYHCAASSTYMKTDGTGWIPINFNNYSAGKIITTLPVDPINTTSSGEYYIYVTNGTSYEVMANPGSTKNLGNTAAFIKGSDLTLLTTFPGASGGGPSGTPGTWYIRTDGGTATQCTGMVNASYPGSGTGQPCAFNHPYWLLNASGTWNIAAGNIIQFEDQGPYYMGEQNGGIGTDWHAALAGICPSPNSGRTTGYTCVLPPFPNNVQILGVNNGNCHTSDHVGLLNPTVLSGISGASSVLNFQGTNGDTASCLEITQPDTCTRVSGGCTNSSNSIFAGIIFESGTQGPSNLTLKDIAVVGAGGYGISGGRINTQNSDVTNLSDVHLLGNGLGGWSEDDGYCGTNSTCDSVGTMNFNYVDIEWNGCVAVKPYNIGISPETSPNGFNYCYGSNFGGYGDGFAAVSTGNMTLNVNHSTFKYNTQDGFDLVHWADDALTSPILNLSNSWAEGNAGQGFKFLVVGTSTVINNVLIDNCRVLSQSSTFPNNPSGWAMSTSDSLCRAAGTQWAMVSTKGNLLTFENNTTIGYGSTMYQTGCTSAYPNCALVFKNNISVGYPDPGNSNRLPNGFYFNVGSCPGSAGSCVFSNSGSAIDHNLWYNMYTGCPLSYETNYICANPLFTASSSVDALDPHLNGGSPAHGAGTTISGVTADYFGTTRANPPSIGAVE